MEKFGKDHWSLLAYVGCRVVDNEGTINNEHLRCHPERHPHYVGWRRAEHGGMWDVKYSTRLAGFFETEGEDQLNYRLDDHDDWDCLQDLEIAGLIKIHGTGLHPLVALTKYGHKIEARLRRHKADKGQFNEFHDVFMAELKDLKRPKPPKEPVVSIILDHRGEPIPKEVK
jgi:hypothetical protein